MTSTEESAAHGWGSWRYDTCDGHRWLVHNSHIAAYSSSTYNADSSPTIFRFMNTVAHLTLHDFYFFFAYYVRPKRRRGYKRPWCSGSGIFEWINDGGGQKCWVVAVMQREESEEYDVVILKLTWDGPAVWTADWKNNKIDVVLRKNRGDPDGGPCCTAGFDGGKRKNP